MEAVQGKKMRVADQVWENRVKLKLKWSRVGELEETRVGPNLRVYETRVGELYEARVGPKVRVYEARVGLLVVRGVGPKGWIGEKWVRIGENWVRIGENLMGIGCILHEIDDILHEIDCSHPVKRRPCYFLGPDCGSNHGPDCENYLEMLSC
ncbi:hypothetical protein FCV25MIE_09101 [Fagus crenata]